MKREDIDHDTAGQEVIFTSIVHKCTSMHVCSISLLQPFSYYRSLVGGLLYSRYVDDPTSPIKLIHDIDIVMDNSLFMIEVFFTYSYDN